MSFISREAITDEIKCIALARIRVYYSQSGKLYVKTVRRSYERRKMEKDKREGVERERRGMREIYAFKATGLVSY